MYICVTGFSFVNRCLLRHVLSCVCVPFDFLSSELIPASSCAVVCVCAFVFFFVRGLIPTLAFFSVFFSLDFFFRFDFLGFFPTIFFSVKKALSVG